MLAELRVKTAVPILAMMKRTKMSSTVVEPLSSCSFRQFLECRLIAFFDDGFRLGVHPRRKPQGCSDSRCDDPSEERGEKYRQDCIEERISFIIPRSKYPH
jgi:hypothetical protein